MDWVDLKRTMKQALLRSGILALPGIRRRLSPLGYSFKRLMLRDIAEEFRCEVFVETGTSYGETSRYMARFVGQVLTCEPYPRLFEYNAERNSHLKNITMWNKGSEECFAEMLGHVRGRPLFWLDGHYSGDGTALTQSYTPIIRELRLIGESGLGGVVAIDDVRLFESCQNVLAGTFEKGYPQLETIVALLRKSLPENQLRIVGDCLLSLPYCWTPGRPDVEAKDGAITDTI